MSKAKKFPQFFAAFCVCIGAMGTGTVISWTSNITEELESGDLNNVKPDLKWAGSIICLGATFVCIPIGILADLIGRKGAVLLAIIPFIIGWVLIILTKHAAMLLIGRFLTGMGGGSFCILAPLYTSEIAEIEIRGTLGAFMQLFITIGVLWSNLLGWLLPLILFCISCAAVPVACGLLFMFQPETPVYFIKTKRKEKALAVFRRLRGKDYDPSEEVAEIEKYAAIEEELKNQFVDQLKSKQGWKSTLICFMLMFYQQLSGINEVTFFSGNIFKLAASSIKPQLCVTIVGVVQIISTIFSTWYIEALGRKVLLMISAGVMGFSTLLMSIYFLIKDFELVSKETIKSIGWLPLLSLTLFIIAFSFGLGPIPWLATSELCPLAIMSRMSAYAVMFNWFLAFLITVAYVPVSTTLGSYTSFLVFTVSSTSAVFFVLFVMPETRGKHLQEIQDELGK